MKIEIKVPTMGESIAEATIGTFIKPTGSQVSPDEELIELETDKVNQVLYAQEAGVVTWNVSKDEVVKIGQLIGFIDTEQKAQVAEAQKEPSQKTSPAEEPQEKKAQLAETPVQKPPESEPEIEPNIPKIPPSPPEKGARFSKDLFLTELASAKHPPEAKKAPEQPFVKPEKPINASERRETRNKMSKIRRIIANKLVDVMQHTAMLTTFNEVDMTNIIAMRETYKEAFSKKYQTRLGFMSFFVKAAISALQAFPEVNTYIDGEDIVSRGYYDISIAISTDRGLIVPVIRDCDRLSFPDIEKAIERYASLAREGGLSPDDLQGGGFTITNGGIYGSLLSTPILNPPQSAILGMHKIIKRPVVIDDEITIRQMMYLALSYDHRVIDGKEAVSFLVHIKNNIEDPSRLLLDI